MDFHVFLPYAKSLWHGRGVLVLMNQALGELDPVPNRSAEAQASPMLSYELAHEFASTENKLPVVGFILSTRHLNFLIVNILCRIPSLGVSSQMLLSPGTGIYTYFRSGFAVCLYDILSCFR